MFNRALSGVKNYGKVYNELEVKILHTQKLNNFANFNY